MSSFTPEQQDELTRLIQMQVARSDLATLVRQLQGGASFPADAGKRRASTTVHVTWPGGSVFSNPATITHNFGSVARVLANVQDQFSTGAAWAFEQTVLPNSFQVLATTGPNGNQPSSSAASDITVVYWEQ